MRDPKRIKEFCDQLAEVWEQNYPDWRFGQLISNVYGIQEPSCFFFGEDDVLLARLTEYAERKQANNK